MPVSASGRKTPTLQQFFAERIAKRIRRVLDEFGNVRRNPDLKATHDLSTAIRRLLVLDGMMRQMYDRRLLGKKLRRRIKDFRSTLGDVRNIQEIREKLKSLKHKSAFGDAFLQRLNDDESKLLNNLSKAVNDFAVSPLEDINTRSGITKFCRGKPVIEPAALIARLLEDVKAMVEPAIKERGDDALHRMRIRFKKYRYAVEAFAPVFSGADDAWLKYLREFQTWMGEAHDWLVLSQEMRRFAKEHKLAGVRMALVKIESVARKAHSDARKWIAANMKNLDKPPQNK